MLKNIKLSPSVLQLPEAQKACEISTNVLGEEGRLVVRPSGTEPLVRIMVEHKNKNVMNEVANSLAEALISLSQKAVA